MEQLTEILANDRVHIFGPREYSNRIRQAYQIVSYKIQEGADRFAFETNPERIIWYKQGEAHENLFETTTWAGSLADAWRKILEYDKDLSRYFEIIEDVPERIECRVIELNNDIVP